MKKISILFVWVFVLGTVLTSCSKDDVKEEDKGPINMDLIIGKWVFGETKLTTHTVLGDLSANLPYEGNVPGCAKDYIEIKSGGVAVSGDYTKPTDDTAVCGPFVEKPGSWSQSGNNITLTIEGTPLVGTFEVIKVSTTELVVKIDATRDGKPTTITQYYTKG